MTAALFGELNVAGDQIALVAAAADDFGLKLAATRLQYLTALGEHPRNDDGSANMDVLLVPATWATVTQIGRMFSGNGSRATWNPQPKLAEWIMAEAIRRMTPPPPLPPDVCPPWLKPYDFQAQDAAALAAAGKVLLLHEVGTGKTVISLLGLEARRQAGHEIFPMIIVVPGWDVGDVWDSHIREWMPRWPEPVMHQGASRARVRGWRDRNWILITTYATARRDAKDARDLLPGLKPTTVIADEAHMCGNDRSQQSQAVQRIARHADAFIAASGTLVTHSMKNVYPALACLDHASWPSWDRAKGRYIAIRKDPSGQGEDVILGLRPEMEAEFFACLDGQILRRAKADVLDQLPPKIYSVRRPEMPDEWRRAYDGMEREMLAELPDGGELPVMSTLAQLTRLSQLASSAADVTVTEEIDPDTGLLVKHYHVRLKRPCWKAETLLGILTERPGQPTAVFTESRQLAMLTGEHCEQAGYRTGYIVGTGADGITRATRQQAVTDFQAGRLDVIMCTAGAGGVGITLTAGNCAVMLQRSWQLDLAIQPEGRIDRIGAEIHDHLEIVDVVTRGTVDQRRRDVLREKAGQLGQLVRDVRVVRELLGGIK